MPLQSWRHSLGCAQYLWETAKAGLGNARLVKKRQKIRYSVGRTAMLMPNRFLCRAGQFSMMEKSAAAAQPWVGGNFSLPGFSRRPRGSRRS
jgi:hypothetical protein